MSELAQILGRLYAQATEVPWILLTGPIAVALAVLLVVIFMRWLKRITGNDWLRPDK
jgi:hypothetical protein